MPKFDSLTQYVLNKKYISMKENSDLGIRIFYLNRKPILILNTLENKLCFYNNKRQTLQNTKAIPEKAFEIQWTNCKYLKENEWQGLIIEDQTISFIEKFIDEFYFMTEKSLKNNR